MKKAAFLLLVIVMALCSCNAIYGKEKDIKKEFTVDNKSSDESVQTENNTSTEESKEPVIITAENMTEAEKQAYESIVQKLPALLYLYSDLSECTLSCPIRVYDADYEMYADDIIFYILADNEIKYMVSQTRKPFQKADDLAKYCYKNNLPISYIFGTGADLEGYAPSYEQSMSGVLDWGCDIVYYDVYYSDGEFYGTGSNYTRLPEEFSPEQVNIANLTPQYITDMGEPIKAAETLEEALEIIS